MTLATLPRRRGLLLALLAGAALALLAAPAMAAPAVADFTSQTAALAGSSFTSIVQDRNRLIQVSVLIVTLGVALLWMKK